MKQRCLFWGRLFMQNREDSPPPGREAPMEAEVHVRDFGYNYYATTCSKRGGCALSPLGRKSDTRQEEEDSPT